MKGLFTLSKVSCADLGLVGEEIDPVHTPLPNFVKMEVRLVLRQGAGHFCEMLNCTIWGLGNGHIRGI
jgi:hypothetical protein